MLLKNITEYLGILLSRDEFTDSNELTIQVGPQTNFSEKVVKKVLITQFLTIKSISNAKKEKYNLILCRYGIPPFSLSNIDEFTQKFLLLLLHAHIMVGILPKQWDYTSEGPIDYLAKILGLHYHSKSQVQTASITGKTFIAPKPLKIERILSVLHRSLNIEEIQIISKPDSIHQTFTIFPCSTPSKEIRLAKFQGSDIILSPPLSPSSLMELKFYELSHIQIPFYTIMESSLKHLCSILATEFPRIEFAFQPSDNLFQIHVRKQNH
jgi:putative NIF3 family GTP cyclohydrolase 1 type 2